MFYDVASVGAPMVWFPRPACRPPPSASCSYGWRISLGLAALPATVLALGGIFLPDSPNSLIERGHKEKGRAVLVSIRGTEEVDAGARQGGRRRALCSLARVGAGRVGCHGMPR